MIKAASQVIKNITTESDNSTYDAASILWIAGVISFMIYSGYDLYSNKRYNSVEYGTGLGIVLAGGGLGVKIKNQNSKISPESLDVKE